MYHGDAMLSFAMQDVIVGALLSVMNLEHSASYDTLP